MVVKFVVKILLLLHDCNATQKLNKHLLRSNPWTSFTIREGVATALIAINVLSASTEINVFDTSAARFRQAGNSRGSNESYRDTRDKVCYILVFVSNHCFRRCNHSAN